MAKVITFIPDKKFVKMVKWPQWIEEAIVEIESFDRCFPPTKPFWQSIPIIRVWIYWLMNLRKLYLKLFTNRCLVCEKEMIPSGYYGQHKCYHRGCKMFNIKV